MYWRLAPYVSVYISRFSISPSVALECRRGREKKKVHARPDVAYALQLSLNVYGHRYVVKDPRAYMVPTRETGPMLEEYWHVHIGRVLARC